MAGGINLYTYANNNPLRWFDPWGLTPQTAAQAQGGDTSPLRLVNGRPSTTALTFSVSGSIIPSGSASIDFALDSNYRFDVLLTFSRLPGLGLPGANVAGGVSVYDTTIENLLGDSYEFSAGFYNGIGGEYQLTLQPHSPDQYGGGSLLFGLGTPGVEAALNPVRTISLRDTASEVNRITRQASAERESQHARSQRSMQQAGAILRRF